MKFELFTADCLQDRRVVQYPHKQDVTDLDSLKRACSRDYVCAEYLNNHRKNENFIISDCLPMDCDNSHSEDSKYWKSVEDVKRAFPGVAFAVHYSRNHLKIKKGKPPRPKFHILFPIEPIKDFQQYKKLKKRIQEKFPVFDSGATDAARFFFGTEDPQVEIVEGPLYIDEFLTEDFYENIYDAAIPEGHRNNALLVAGDKAVIRFGDSETARERFDQSVEKCDPPLPADEVETVWKQCVEFFHDSVEGQPWYTAPELYNGELNYKPISPTDKGQAAMLKKTFGNQIRFSGSTNFLYYDGKCWRQDPLDVQNLVFQLAEYQLYDARGKIRNIKDSMSKEAVELIENKSPTVAKNHMPPDDKEKYEEYKELLKYEKYALNQLNVHPVENCMKALRSITKIDINEMDQQPFFLNTPEATYDLRLGLQGAREHDPLHLISKITAVSPGDAGKDMWLDCLDTIFCGDQELIDYVQEICGLAAIGEVKVEMLIIAYGDGANGKSTFWNTISRVLGDYSGRVSAETLTNSARHNVKAEMADLRARRLAIASEMGYGQSLNDAVVKQLCSTDLIYANPKYKDPFKFTPQQTVVLYTNNLPKVRGTDKGIWRRLKVIPFNAVIEGDADKKNYASDLFEQAGPAVLSWIIEGAQRIIAKEYKLEMPAVVEEATAEYREVNDWLAPFLNECCTRDLNSKERSNDLFLAYKNYCIKNGEKPRGISSFSKAMKSADFEYCKISNGKHYVPYFKGLKLIPQQPTPEDDFEKEDEDYGF